jgi:hypothetical protein
MQFSASKAFSQAFQLLGSSFGKLVAIWLTFFAAIIALIAAFGGMFVAMFRTSLAAGSGGFAAGQSPFAGFGFSIILFYLVYFAVIFAQQLALSRASTGRDEDTYSVALNAGLRGTPTMMGVLLIYIIAGIAGGIVISLLMAAIVAALQSGPVSLVLSLLMAIGFFYVFARLSLVLPVVAIGEQRNPITAIATAWGLSAGNALKIMAIWFLAFVAAFVLYMIAMAATVGIPGSAAPGVVPGPGVIIAMFVVMLVLGLSIGLYMVTLCTAIYDQLAPTSIDATAEAFE